MIASPVKQTKQSRAKTTSYYRLWHQITISSLPSAGPLIVYVSGDPRNPEAGEAILVCPPAVPLGFV